MNQTFPHRRVLRRILYCLLFPFAALSAEPAAEPVAGTEIVHPTDQAIMVYVPSGPFIMGMDRDEANTIAVKLGYRDYHQIAAEEWFPKRRAQTSGYFIDKYEVTNERWSTFVQKSAFKSTHKPGKMPVEKNDGEYSLYPVVRVLWSEAQRYANWAGKQLPSEEQWEKAARGTDGRLFPWGNELPTHDHGVFVNLKNDHPSRYQIVGNKPKGISPFGCLDMAGNVYEWTRDWHEPYPNNPERERLLSYMGHENGCLRGGSFYHARHAYICAKRFGFKPTETYYHVGFRTVWAPPDDYFQSKEFDLAKAALTTRKAKLSSMRQAANLEPPTHF